MKEDNLEGKYAGQLFVVSSKREQLDVVNQDMELLLNLINKVDIGK